MLKLNKMFGLKIQFSNMIKTIMMILKVQSSKSNHKSQINVQINKNKQQNQKIKEMVSKMKSKIINK